MATDAAAQRGLRSAAGWHIAHGAGQMQRWLRRVPWIMDWSSPRRDRVGEAGRLTHDKRAEVTQLRCDEQLAKDMVRDHRNRPSLLVMLKLPYTEANQPM